MNSKRAKKLRALVKHLQNKGAVSEDWIYYGSQTTNGQPTSVMLDPACGRAIYQQMKKRDATKIS